MKRSASGSPPAFEIARLLQIVGIAQLAQRICGIPGQCSAIDIAALYASLRARRHSLAVLCQVPADLSSLSIAG